ATIASGSIAGVVDYPQKIGDPYEIDGKTYTPEEVASYDNVGYASWYGQELAGNPTANGERFNPDGISAAHKTLPLPSYVEVTALDTGRTILVRVNDRGPFANDRIIDLSQGAARQLGIEKQGVAGVRARKVNPNEQERAVLRAGGVATERIATPDSLLSILRKNLSKMPRPAAPKRQARASVAPSRSPGASYTPQSDRAIPQAGSRDGRFIIEGPGPSTISRGTTGTTYGTRPPVAMTGSGGAYVVQIAAFGSKSRAGALARKTGAKVVSDRSGRIWRVRYGPYSSEKDAKSGLAQARRQGYGNARIFRTDK
ncbi:Septum-associated rare lipoprotein A, partial [hydrothermal vent metagenome]